MGIVNDEVARWARSSGVAPASQQDPTAAQHDKPVATLEEKITSLKNGGDPLLKASVSQPLEALKEIQRQAVLPNLPAPVT